MSQQQDPKPCAEVSATREIIENQLLHSLSDKSKVALLLTKDDLELLVSALILAELDRMSIPKYIEFRRDLEQLRDAAFK